MPKSANSVLVIDDEPQIRRFVGAGLELHGYLVKEVETGAAGLSAAAHMQPDVIVLDLELGTRETGSEMVTHRVAELAAEGFRVVVFSVHVEPLIVQVNRPPGDLQQARNAVESGGFAAA